jgi:chromosomal replication initiation ATPase DnaA
MNFHVAGLTPTQRSAVIRHRSFRETIAAKAAELADRKANEALNALRVVALETPLSLTPSLQSVTLEDVPEEADPLAQNWFEVLPAEPKRSDFPSIRDIQKAVCKLYDVKLVDMLSSRRTAIIVKPRQVAMFLSKTLTLHSLPQIGRRFAGKDHTTVLHAVRKTERLCLSDAALAHDIAILTEAITGIQQ